MNQEIISQEDINSLPDTRKYGPKGIPLEAIIELRKKNLSTVQIATLLGCTPHNIQIRLKDVELVKDFVSNRSTIFSHPHRIILNSITSADIKKANLRDKIISAGVLYDKERLETGQSTQIMGYADALKARDGVKITLEEIRRIKVERHGMQKVSSLDSQGFAGDGKNEPLSIDMQVNDNIQDVSL